jgi:hypothetical protein
VKDESSTKLDPELLPFRNLGRIIFRLTVMAG